MGSKIVLLLVVVLFFGFVVAQEEFSREAAADAINESREIIEEMRSYGFSTVFVEDQLVEAESVLEIVDNAEVLRDEESLSREKSEAGKALSLIDWEEMYYEDVLVYTERIVERQEEAFLISDSIVSAETSLGVYGGIDDVQLSPGYGDVDLLMEEINLAFEEERYEDAEGLLEEMNLKLEEIRQENAALSGLKRNAANFFERYSAQIVLFVAIVGVLVFVFHRKISHRLLVGRIGRMQAEKKALVGMMKKAQTERFKDGTLSALVYNIRVKKYGEKLNEIKEKLPALEKRLDGFRGLKR